ncbi:MAG: glycosyl hydrolase family 18 protein [Deltaproteobacteria bacterium]
MKRALVLAGLLLPSTALAQSPHQEALEAHQNVAPFDFPPPPVIHRADEATPRVKRVVYGYYPYWVDAWEHVRWDLLTHIAYFSVNMNGDGTLGTTNGWPDTDFVDTAHQHGVKVDVSFTLFSGAEILQLCSNDTFRARGIGNMIDAMEAGGADGVNVDFESVNDGTRDCFTQYIRELRETLTARGHDNAVVSIAGPAVDWTGEFDLLALSEYTDIYFIMGYGYHWTRSSKPGPIGQLRVTESWRPHVSISMQRTLDHYTSLVPADRRAVIVFGVPYYGRDWPVTSSAMHAATTGNGSARTYVAARDALAAGRARQYDGDSENPFYVYQSGGSWRQAWYDDEESLAAKYQLALEQEIGGIGMWALGYDGAYPELWDVVDAYFTEEPVRREGMRATPKMLTLPATVEDDTRTAPSNYFNRYACAPGTPEYGREIVYAFDVCQPGVVEATVTDGAGVDIDLHLLTAPDEASCVARDDRTISQAIAPGRHYLVADSFVSNLVPLPGAFTLDVAFTPDAESEPCPEGTSCVAGRCVSLQPSGPSAGPSGTPQGWLPPPETTTPTVTEPEPMNPETPSIPEAPAEEETPETVNGCGCTTTAEPALPAAGILGVFLWRRRRRR